ncbi:MAG: hypothetical protein WC833_08540 [Bacteroidales bacterium]
MKTQYLLIVSVLFLALFSCQKDVMKEINEGKWNKERNITEIKFENQIGLATISRSGETATVSFKYNMDATGSKKIKMTSLVPSWGANANVKSGDILDFDNADNKAKIIVISADGAQLEWIVTMIPFVEPIKGEWKVAAMMVYGGVDGGAYGGDAWVNLATQNSVFLENPPSCEMDNIYTFEQKGFTESGNSYGNIINNSGADGKYADFKWKNGTDNAERVYRLIPRSGGKWEHDAVTDEYIIKDVNGNLIIKTKFRRDVPFEYKPNNKKGYTFTNNTLVFNVKTLGLFVGSWNWMYNSYDAMIANPWSYCVSLKR